MRFSSPGQTSSHLTEKRILGVGPHGKAHSAPEASRKSAFCLRHLTEKRILQVGSHRKAHSVREQSRRVRLSVRDGARVRFSVECTFPHLGKRRATSRKSAFCLRHLTEKRILDRDRSASLRRAPSRRVPTFLLSVAPPATRARFCRLQAHAAGPIAHAGVSRREGRMPLSSRYRSYSHS